MTRRFHSAHGFTLVELTQVILLISILSVMAIPQFIDFATDGKIVVSRNRLLEIKQAISGDPSLKSHGQFVSHGFEIHMGSLPESLNDLVVRGNYPHYDPFTKRGWRGPYLSTKDSNWNKDSWGIPLNYDKANRQIKSCGPDQTCGSADDLVLNL